MFFLYFVSDVFRQLPTSSTAARWERGGSTRSTPASGSATTWAGVQSPRCETPVSPQSVSKMKFDFFISVFYTLKVLWQTLKFAVSSRGLCQCQTITTISFDSNWCSVFLNNVLKICDTWKLICYFCWIFHPRKKY